MPTPLEQLRAIRDSLRAQLDLNEVFLTWIAVESAVRQLEAANCGPAQFVSAAAIPTPRVTGRVPDMAVNLIQAENAPLTTLQIYSRLVEAGASFEGASPIKNLRSALSKDARLASVHWGAERAWWLKGRELPAAPCMSPMAQKESTPPAPTGEADKGFGVNGAGGSLPTASAQGA